MDCGALVKLCDFLGMRADREVWRAFAGQRLNVGVEETGPPAWSKEQRAIFEPLAGDVQGAWYAD